MNQAETSAEISRWCIAPGKRALDLLCTIPAVIVLSPFMLLIAAGVRVTSGSPILFRQRRFGRNGRLFECLKFRTMKLNSGVGITQAGDARVTKIGRILRKWKLDELPQLLNVLSGEMSLVGPRPDLPIFIAELDGASRQSLAAIRPGITGWATLHFRHEEELLAHVAPERLQATYIREVLPKKIDLDLEYAAHATFASDLKILLQTLLAIF